MHEHQTTNAVIRIHTGHMSYPTSDIEVPLTQSNQRRFGIYHEAHRREGKRNCTLDLRRGMSKSLIEVSIKIIDTSRKDLVNSE